MRITAKNATVVATADGGVAVAVAGNELLAKSEALAKKPRDPRPTAAEFSRAIAMDVVVPSALMLLL